MTDGALMELVLHNLQYNSPIKNTGAHRGCTGFLVTGKIRSKHMSLILACSK